MLLEPFKSQVNDERKLHLDEQKVADLKTAAVLAADYALTNEKIGSSHKPYPVKKHWSGHNSGKLQCRSNDDVKWLSHKVISNRSGSGKLKTTFTILRKGLSNLSLRVVFLIGAHLVAACHILLYLCLPSVSISGATVLSDYTMRSRAV